MLYHEQKMVTANDNITRNLGYCKVIFPFNLDDFVQKRYPKLTKPNPPKDLELWMQYNECNGMNTKTRRVSSADPINEEADADADPDDWSSSSSN